MLVLEWADMHYTSTAAKICQINRRVFREFLQLQLVESIRNSNLNSAFICPILKHLIIVCLNSPRESGGGFCHSLVVTVDGVKFFIAFNLTITVTL